ncbi:MAG: enoyl-CoA hydratase/isomerase family protein [Rhodobacteraceae bacterium]|nr:enoyl-CoA hydratase/isomerase family protein [Paracoccaceae bacterium]
MTDHAETRIAREGAALVIRFDRPQARNALTDRMLAETRAAMLDVLHDPDIAAVILTGDERSFCAGGDLKAAADSDLGPYDKYRARHVATEWHDFVRFLARYPRPVIAAVEGHCLGGGLEIALLCDFIVAADSADMGLTEARFSLFPILGGAWSLTRAVGARRAKEMMFTARRIGAQEAHAIGLVAEVTPAGAACPRAVEIAGVIAENGPLAVMAAKQAVMRAPSQGLDEALATGGDLSALMFFSEDRAEGLAAFREKRPAAFRGR